jgi:hypothetical protein
MLINPILHTAWLNIHALTLKINTAKYYFHEKSKKARGKPVWLRIEPSHVKQPSLKHVCKIRLRAPAYPVALSRTLVLFIRSRSTTCSAGKIFFTVLTRIYLCMFNFLIVLAKTVPF